MATPSNIPISPEVAVLGGSLCLAIGLLFLVVARRMGMRWPLWLAAAYISYALALAIWHLKPFGGRAGLPVVATVIAVPYVLLTVGIWQHTRQSGLHWLDRSMVLLLGFIGLIVVAAMALPVDVNGMRLAAGAIWCTWAWRFLQADRAEPQQGHLISAIVCLGYPLLLMLGPIESLPAGARRVPILVPTLALGVSLLVTTLLQLQKRAAWAHQQAADALRQQLEAEAAMQQLGNSIEQRMALRFGELNANLAGLESFNRQVSHDLRGPLGSMAQVAGLARERIAAGDSDSAERMLTVLQRQAQISFEAVDALLWLARAEQAPLQWKLVDSQAVVEELCQLLVDEGRLPAGAVQVRQLPPLRADAALLRQLFRNLLTNAAKFSRPDVPLQVTVQARAEAGYWIFEVRDNGRGFARDDAARIFRPFERADAQAGIDGVGVGLSIVQRIVQRHGGWVDAEGLPGQGAVFRCALRAGATASEPSVRSSSESWRAPS